MPGDTQARTGKTNFWLGNLTPRNQKALKSYSTVSRQSGIMLHYRTVIAPKSLQFNQKIG